MVVFLLALLLRIALLGVVSHNPQGIYQPDSTIYLGIAKVLVREGAFYTDDKQTQSYNVRMPGYPLLLASSLSLTGEFWPVIGLQILLDAMTCVLIFGLSEKLWRGSGWLSGLTAACNIGMMTYALFILNDSLFLFFFTAFLLALADGIRKMRWRTSAAIGLAMGIAALVRPVMNYIPFFVAPLVFSAMVIRAREPLLESFARTVLMIAAFLAVLLPWAAYNHSHFRSFRLTAQEGEHLLQYIVPSVWQYSRGIPFMEGMKKANHEFEERAAKQGVNVRTADPFLLSDFQAEIALEILRGESKTAVIKAWLFGIAKNLFAPAIVDLSSLLKVERPHFFYTAGNTALEQVWNFVGKTRGVFGGVLLASLFGLILIRLVQVWGLVRLFWENRWEGALLVLVVAYFLLISGPIGYAKYRLPFEPLLIVLFSIGLKDLYGRWKGKRLTPAQLPEFG